MRKSKITLSVIVLLAVSAVALAAMPARGTLHKEKIKMATCLLYTTIKDYAERPLRGVRFFVKVHTSVLNDELREPAEFSKETDFNGVIAFNVARGATVTVSALHPAFATPATFVVPDVESYDLRLVGNLASANPPPTTGIQISGPGLAQSIKAGTVVFSGDVVIDEDPQGQANVAFTPGVTSRIYIALLTQSGTSNPTVIVLKNTMSGDIAWTRTATGDYAGTLTNAFTEDKTAIQVGSLVIDDDSTLFNKAEWQRASRSAVRIVTKHVDVRGQAVDVLDGLLNQTRVQIEVFL